ncbi:MAG: hypothetical protein E7266_07545 [Lachnospiraceae bacterium]|nr:hypothetical protein [Lachnospiraceae bacterium]
MKKKFFAVVATTVITAMMSLTAFASSFQLTESSTYKYANPLKGTNPEEVTIEYTITAADNAAANGWDGILSFYNSSTLGRVSIQSHPYVCWNSANAAAGWIDHKASALQIKKGVEQSYKIVINKDGIQMFLNGEAITSADTGTSAGDATPIAVTYQNILDEINGCDYFFVGVGKAQYCYWNTEVCTLTGVKVNGKEFDPDKILQEETTTLGVPEKNTMDYGVPVDDSGSVNIVPVIVVSVVAVLAVVVVVVVLVIVISKGKKKNNDEEINKESQEETNSEE